MSGEAPKALDPGSLRASAACAYLLIGLPDGMLGVAWPSILRELHLPLDTLGVLLLASTFGYLSTSSISGRTFRRFGLLVVLAGATSVQVFGAIGLAGARSLPFLMAGAGLLGLAAGAIDPALSTNVSLGARPSYLNVLQAVYCVGAALARVAVLLAVWEASWRLAYVGLAAAQVGLMMHWLTRARTRQPETEIMAPVGAEVFRVSVLALTVTAFFLAASLELATASWAASYLGEGRTGATLVVGLGVIAFWSTLAASRFAAATTPSGWGPALLAPIGALTAALGGLLLWTAPRARAVAAFAVLGLGIGPLYPALALMTPARLGRRAAPSAMGSQLAAGSVGASLCPAVAGVVLQHGGFSATGPILLPLAVMSAAVLLVLQQMAPLPLVLAKQGL
jgi:fucose permease